MIKNTIEIKVDLSKVTSTFDLMDRFVKAFGLTPCHGRWDVFLDYFTSLTTESSLVINKNFSVEEIRLKLINLMDVKDFSEKDYHSLLEVLVLSTNLKNRNDGIKFSFEVCND